MPIRPAILLTYSLVLGIPAVVLGAVAVREINRSHGVMDGKGMAIWGIVLGAIGVTILVMYVILRPPLPASLFD